MTAEQYRETIIKYRQLSAQAIRQYDGYIAQTMGDGIFIYFGYPQAHEDDAVTAFPTMLPTMLPTR
jgi:class 3 adenylate cyclase